MNFGLHKNILLDNDTEFKNHLMDQVLQQLGTECIFFTPDHSQSNRKLEVFQKYLNPTLKKQCEKDASNWEKYINQVCRSHRVIPNFATVETPFLWSTEDPQLNFISPSGTNAIIPWRSRIQITQQTENHHHSR